MTISRREMIGLIAGGAIAGAAPAAAQEGPARPAVPPAPPEEPIAAWVRRAAQPFDAGPSRGALRPLAERLAGARVIGIGEATHGTHEDLAFKAALIQALIEHGGVRTIAIECNHRPGLAFDRYVTRGEGDPVAIVQGDDFFQNWKVEEYLGLVSWIRAWNAAGRDPVRVIGVDCQAVGTDTLRAIEWLRPRDAAAAAALEADLRPLIADPALREGRSYELIQSLDAAQFAAATTATERLAAAIAARAGRGEPGQAEAAHAATAAHQGMMMHVPMTRFATPAQQQDPLLWARRDDYMAQNIVALAGGSPTAYWAHNFHVLPVDLAPGGASTCGGYLRTRIGAGYRNVIFDFDGGRIHAKPQQQGGPPPGRSAPWQAFDRPSVAGSAARLLAAAGPERFWIDLRAAAMPAAFRTHPYVRDWPGFVVVPGVAPGDADRVPLGDGGDILVFFRRMTPSRLLPFVPQG